MPRKRPSWIDSTTEAVQAAAAAATRASLEAVEDAVDAAMEATRASLESLGGRGESTRARILDVALELFLAQGYEKTSLREIAERMGFTKAALYYHFASKSDILGALHMRLHRLMDGGLEQLGEGSPTPEAWGRFLEGMIAKLQSSGKLLALHLRDQAALGELHLEGHHQQHEELEQRMRAMMSDSSIPLDQRLRMVTALAAVFFAPMSVSQGADEDHVAELAPIVRQIVRDILRLDD